MMRLFYLKKSNKFDKPCDLRFLKSAVLSVCFILICATVLCFSAFSYYKVTVSTGTSGNNVRTADYGLSIKIGNETAVSTNMGASHERKFSAASSTDTAVTITKLTGANQASVGFVKITVTEPAGSYYVAMPTDSNTLTRNLSVLGAGTVTVEPHWGVAANYPTFLGGATALTGNTITVGTAPAVVYNTFTHSDNFANVDKYLYRVGNGNNVTLGSLFKVDTAGTNGVVSDDVSISVEKVETNSTVSAAPTYTKDLSDWTKSTLKFTGEGPVQVTINEGTGESYTLNLEVVSAKNVTAYSELANSNCVLLNDITMSSGGKYTMSNASLYGNGFTFDVRDGKCDDDKTGTATANAVILLINSKLDNIKIIGKVYTEVGLTRYAKYSFACVNASGTCEITNSYISNCASPIRTNGGNLLLKNTTLKGGAFCNIDIRSAAKVTADGLTTINQSNGNDTADNGKKIVGLGILFYYEGMNGAEAFRIADGGLTQYNYISENDDTISVMSQSPVDQVFDNAPSSAIKTINGVKWANAGIVSTSTGTQASNVDAPNGYVSSTVRLLGQSGYLWTEQLGNSESTGFTTLTPPAYSSNAQYAIAPNYSFEHPTASGKKNYQAKTGGSNDYCYWDSATSSILIGFEEGSSKSFDPNILTVNKYGMAITPEVSVDGGAYQSVSNSITITTEGTHTLKYKYTDIYNYDSACNRSYNEVYYKEVKLTVTVAIASISPATFDFNGRGYKTVIANNTTYVMPNVSATATNSIGSKSIGGQTVYYPIVFPWYSTSQNGNLTRVTTSSVSGSNMYVWCPVFDQVVTITDYNLGGTTTVYGTSTTTLADGKLTYVESGLKTALTWSGANSPSLDPVVKNGKVYFRSTTASTNARSQTTPVIEYIYIDNAGNIYHYFVGYYFPEKTKSGGGCVAEGTMITLADGTQKPIEQLDQDDMILAFDHYTGKYVSVPVLAVFNHGYDEYDVIDLAFSDETELRIINEHSLFDIDTMKYEAINADNYTNYIGHRFVKYSSDSDDVMNSVVLTSGNANRGYSECWGTWGYSTLGCLTNGMLSLPTAEGTYNYFTYNDNMMYDDEEIAADIETYGLYTYEDWADLIPYEVFDAYNFKYFKIAIGKGLATYETYLCHIDLFYELSRLKEEN